MDHLHDMISKKQEQIGLQTAYEMVNQFYHLLNLSKIIVKHRVEICTERATCNEIDY